MPSKQRRGLELAPVEDNFEADRFLGIGLLPALLVVLVGVMLLVKVSTLLGCLFMSSVLGGCYRLTRKDNRRFFLLFNRLFLYDSYQPGKLFSCWQYRRLGWRERYQAFRDRSRYGQ